MNFRFVTAGFALGLTSIATADTPRTSRYQPLFEPNQVITMGRCRMGGCDWSRWLSVEALPRFRRRDEWRLRVTLLGGESMHSDDYPEEWTPNVKISWNRAPHQLVIHCSHRAPKLIPEWERAENVEILPLHPDAPIPGVLENTVSLYFTACHSHFWVESIEDTMRRYGYAVEDILGSDG